MFSKRHTSCAMAATLAWLFAAALASPSHAGKYTGIKTSSMLYTEPSTEHTGGLRAEILNPKQTLLAAVAISPDEPKKKCYRGLVEGTSFSFAHLAPGKYDLVLFYPTQFFEGLSLQRRSESDTLTREDRKQIDETIRRAVPFFDVKEIHRIAGKNGEMGTCRALITYLRTGTTGTTMVSGFSSDTFSGQLRSVRLVLLEDVGPGWQIALTREMHRKEILGEDKTGVLRSRFHKRLNRIRVSDSIKDLGKIDLLQTP